MRFDSKGVSSVINLNDGDSLILPYFGSEILQYRIYTRPHKARNILFTDI
jgi:hypothetical protein